MGCKQSKPSDVVVPDDVNAIDTTKEEFMEKKTMEVAESQELEVEEVRNKQDEEVMDEAFKTFESSARNLGFSTMGQAPDSTTAVHVPDSVRANFSSFNISFIDPTVSAPTSTTTEPNVASTRVIVTSEEPWKSDNRREDDAIKDVERNVEEMDKKRVMSEEAVVVEQNDDGVVMKAEEPVDESVAESNVTSEEEEHVAMIESIKELVEVEVMVENDLVTVLKEETASEEQIGTEVEKVETSYVNIVATKSNEDESGLEEAVEKVEDDNATKAKEFAAACEHTSAVVEQSAVASEEKTGTIDEPVKEEDTLGPVVEETDESVAENLAVHVEEGAIVELVKDENLVAESVVAKAAENVEMNVAESIVDEKVADVVTTIDDKSVEFTEVIAAGSSAVSDAKIDASSKATAFAKNLDAFTEEPAAVATSKPIGNSGETKFTVEMESGSSTKLEDSDKAVDTSAELLNIADVPASASV